MIDEPRISIVLTSHDSRNAKRITDTIESFRAQRYQKKELVVIIEGSEELSRVIKCESELGPQNSVKRYMISAGAGASTARNFGIRQSSGDVISFVDDDVIIAEDWAEQVAKTFALNASCIGLIGPVLPLWQEPHMDWFPDELLWLVSCTGWLSYQGIVPIRGHTWTSNASFRREAFSDETMFSEDLGPRGGVPGWRRHSISEDVELSVRIQKRSGKVVLYNPQVKVWKYVEPSVLSWPHIKDCALGIGASRVTKRQLLSTEGMNAFSLEEKLLKRILLRLLPLSVVATLAGRNSSRRRLLLILFTLFFLSIGYARGIVSQNRARRQPKPQAW